VSGWKAFAWRGVIGVNYDLHALSGVLGRVTDALASGRIVSPPITRVALGDVPGLNHNPGPGGKTVIAFSG
jgi:hypothetical protein